MASAVRLDFGAGVPVTVTPEAQAFLSRLPQPALARVLEALSRWAKKAPLKAVSVIVFSDPEDIDWEEAIIELLVDADFDRALALWDEVGGVLDKAMNGISAEDSAELDEKLGVHLLWGADSWDVESTALRSE